MMIVDSPLMKLSEKDSSYNFGILNSTPRCICEAHMPPNNNQVHIMRYLYVLNFPYSIEGGSK